METINSDRNLIEALKAGELSVNEERAKARHEKLVAEQEARVEAQDNWTKMIDAVMEYATCPDWMSQFIDEEYILDNLMNGEPWNSTHPYVPFKIDGFAPIVLEVWYDGKGYTDYKYLIGRPFADYGRRPGYQQSYWNGSIETRYLSDAIFLAYEQQLEFCRLQSMYDEWLVSEENRQSSPTKVETEEDRIHSNNDITGALLLIAKETRRIANLLDQRLP